MDRERWLKYKDNLSTIYSTSFFNNQVLCFGDKTATSMYYKFIIWIPSTSNPSSWSNMTLLMITPTTMGPIQKWSLFTMTTRLRGCWSMGGKNLHLPTWTWSWWRCDMTLICTTETSSGTALWIIYTYPQTYWLHQQHPYICFFHMISLLIQL